MDLYYIKPWCRIGPYIVGLFTGYILYKTKGQVKIPKVKEKPAFLLLLFVFPFFACFYASYYIFAYRDTANNSFDLIYIKPWCRIGPYVVGLFTGYVLYKTKCKATVPKVNISLKLS